MKRQWKFAALKTKELPDPWVGLGFDKIKEEVAARHMYNPRSGKWKTDKITIKMQSEVRWDPCTVCCTTPSRQLVVKGDDHVPEGVIYAL